MALFRGTGYGQTKLLGKTTGGNSGPKRSGLTGEEDAEEIRKEIGPKQKTKGLEQKAKKEIGEETRLEQKAEGEERTHQ